MCHSTSRVLAVLCRNSLSMFLLACILSGCGGVAVTGLRAVYPPVEKKTFAVSTEFVEVDSLEPTFQWQPFPQPEDDLANRVQDVTYEIRIWAATSGPAGKLIYSHDGIQQPSHKLEKPLAPSTRYLWSIRAHFVIEGNSRVSEWGMAGIPFRNESVPNLSCFRFITPDM